MISGVSISQHSVGLHIKRFNTRQI